MKDIKVRKSRIKIQLDFLKENHPDYRYIIINEQRIDILLVNENIDLRFIYMELVEPIIDARSNTLPNVEHIQENIEKSKELCEQIIEQDLINILYKQEQLVIYIYDCSVFVYSTLNIMMYVGGRSTQSNIIYIQKWEVQ